MPSLAIEHFSPEPLYWLSASVARSGGALSTTQNRIEVPGVTMFLIRFWNAESIPLIRASPIRAPRRTPQNLLQAAVAPGWRLVVS